MANAHEGEGPLEPSLSVLKTLFAHSGNVCAFYDQGTFPPTCEKRLTDPAWEGVNAIVCHIAGRRPGSPGYDPTMSNLVHLSVYAVAIGAVLLPVPFVHLSGGQQVSILIVAVLLLIGAFLILLKSRNVRFRPVKNGE
jgi:hypothetical protein